MENSITIQQILSQVGKLGYEDRLYLVERLIKQLRENQKKAQQSSHHLSQLNKLDSEIWKNVNIDKYVEQEREWS